MALFILIAGITVYMDFLINDKNKNDLFNTLRFIILIVLIGDSLFAHIIIIFISRIEYNNKNKTDDRSMINKQLLINNEEYTDNEINRI